MSQNLHTVDETCGAIRSLHIDSDEKTPDCRRAGARRGRVFCVRALQCPGSGPRARDDFRHSGRCGAERRCDGPAGGGHHCAGRIAGLGNNRRALCRLQFPGHTRPGHRSARALTVRNAGRTGTSDGPPPSGRRGAGRGAARRRTPQANPRARFSRKLRRPTPKPQRRTSKQHKHRSSRPRHRSTRAK